MGLLGLSYLAGSRASKCRGKGGGIPAGARKASGEVARDCLKPEFNGASGTGGSMGAGADRREVVSNPWDMTTGQAAALAAVCKTGSGKVAAMELGISEPAVSRRLESARLRMGASTRTMMLLEWDRWARAQKQA